MKLSGRLVRLRPPQESGDPSDGDGVFEPHADLDPAAPDRAAVVAVYPSYTPHPGMGRSVWCWRTLDGGVTWDGSRIVQPHYDTEGVADPLVAFGADGAIISVAMIMPKAKVDARVAEWKKFKPGTAPGIAEVMRRPEAVRPSIPFELAITRSKDDGRTWTGTVVPGSDDSDKPCIAVDRHQQSPHRGNIYLAWSEHNVEGRLGFTRSTDGGRTFEPMRLIGGRNGLVQTQIAVTPDGAVHLVWHVSLWNVREPDDPRSPTGIFHAQSDDGGVSFSGPELIAQHHARDKDGSLERMGFISLAAAPDGALAAAWSEADLSRAKGGAVRNTVRLIRSPDGRRWTAPVVLATAPDMSQGLPTLTATERAWHLLVYETSPRATAVRIYSAGHNDPELRATAELATRAFGAPQIYLHGNYHLRSAAPELAIVGDYVGLAGSGDRVATAIVLPETDDHRSMNTAYGAILQEG